MSGPDSTSESLPEARRSAAMAWLAILYLAVLALLLPQGADDTVSMAVAAMRGTLVALLLLCHAAIALEAVHGWRRAVDRGAALRRLALVVLVPPLRLGFSPRHPNDTVWLPLAGRVETGRPALERMTARLALPMLLVTLLIVPVIAAELLFAEAVAASPALREALALAMAVIWFGFALEFIVLLSLAPKKLDFCKEHWINIVIILLPLLAFLRSLRMLRFLRAAKAGRMMRVYRLRGLVFRARRIALVFNLIDRIMARNPAKYCEHLEEKIAEREEELERLRKRLEEMRERAG